MARGAAIAAAPPTRRGQIRRLRRVAERALTVYGLEPDWLSLLAHAFNTTFTVVGPDGARYVLHILRPEDDPLSESRRRMRVESELWWLDRLRSDLDLSVPVAVRTPNGESMVMIPVEGIATPLLCMLFHWIDGHFLHRRLMPAHLEAVGRLTARLHDHSARLEIPTGFDRPGVDQADAEIEEGVVRLFTDNHSVAAASVMRAVFRRVRRTQERLGSESASFGLIHADIHQKNYLFRDGAVQLIDFGDCGWGHYVYDLAVTVSELHSSPRREALRTALLHGYRGVRDLSPAHEATIDTFVLLRTVQNLSWFLRNRDDPTYRSRTAQIEEGVAAVERLLGAEG